MTRHPAVLTQAQIVKALKDRSQPTVLRDSKVPGLSLRVGSRAASFYLSYKPLGRRPDGRQFASQDIKIGTVDSHSLAEARREAAELKVQVSLGKDPAALRRAERACAAIARARSTTMRAVADTYIKDGLKGSERHKKTEAGSLRLAISEMGVGETAPAEVSTADILRMLNLHHGRACAVHRFGALNRFFDDLVSRDVVPANPCARVPKRQRPKAPEPRTRVYSASEMQALLRSEGLPPERRRFLTAAAYLPLRFGELAELRGRDIDRERLRICLDHKATKNGDPFMMPIPETVFGEIFTADATGDPDGRLFQLAPGGGPLTARSGLDRQVRAASGVGDFNFHHLRRTFATSLADLGLCDPAVADALLNHRQTATRSGVMAAYNHAALWSQKVAVMTAWAELLGNVEETGRWPER